MGDGGIFIHNKHSNQLTRIADLSTYDYEDLNSFGMAFNQYTNKIYFRMYNVEHCPDPEHGDTHYLVTFDVETRDFEFDPEAMTPLRDVNKIPAVLSINNIVHFIGSSHVRFSIMNNTCNSAQLKLHQFPEFHAKMVGIKSKHVILLFGLHDQKHSNCHGMWKHCLIQEQWHKIARSSGFDMSCGCLEIGSYVYLRWNDMNASHLLIHHLHILS